MNMWKLWIQLDRVLELTNRIIPIAVVPIAAGEDHVPNGAVSVLASIVLKHLFRSFLLSSAVGRHWRAQTGHRVAFQFQRFRNADGLLGSPFGQQLYPS